MSEADTQSHNLKEYLDYVNRKYDGTFSCIHCFDDPNHGDYASRESLWQHCLENHSRWFPTRSDKLLRYREAYEDVCHRAAYVYLISPSMHPLASARAIKTWLATWDVNLNSGQG